LFGVSLVFVLLAALGSACGGPRPPDAGDKTTGVASAVVDPNDRTHTGRAAYYRARVAALREVVAKQRQLAAALGARPTRPEPGIGTD
jgi:hypothetical protein